MPHRKKIEAIIRISLILRKRLRKIKYRTKEKANNYFFRKYFQYYVAKNAT